jgi:hypothetical protein
MVGSDLPTSTVASKLYGMVYGFNMGAVVKLIVNRALEIDLLLVVYIDSKSLYKYLVKLRTT